MQTESKVQILTPTKCRYKLEMCGNGFQQGRSAAHEQCHRSATGHSLRPAGPRAWNRLPPPLRRVHSAAVFKRQLKTFLSGCAFNWHYIVRRLRCALALTSP